MHPTRFRMFLVAGLLVFSACAADEVAAGDTRRWCQIELDRRLLGSTFTLDSPPDEIAAAVEEVRVLWAEALEVVPAEIRSDFEVWLAREKAIWDVMEAAGYDDDAVDLMAISGYVADERANRIDAELRDYVWETCPDLVEIEDNAG